MKNKFAYKKFFGNDYVFSVITKMFSIIVGVFHATFLARFLGPELKGVAASITSVVSVGSVLVTVGIHQAFPYYRKNDSSQSFLNRFCSTIVFVYAILLALAGIAALFIPVTFMNKVSIFLIPLFGYMTIIDYVFLIEYPKKRLFTHLLASCIETVVLLVFWLFFEPNNFLMVVGISIATLFKAVVSTVKVKFSFNYKYVSFKYLLDLIKFGWIPMIALLLTMLNSRLDVIMLSSFSFIASYQIGIYSTGIGLAEKALFVPDAIREILLGKLVAGKETDEVSLACRLGVFVSMSITVVILFFGKFAINLLFGAEYSSAYSVTVICTFGTVFMVFIKMISQYNIVHKKQMINTLFLAVAVIFNALLNFLLVPDYNILGTAIASLVSHLICGLSFAVYFSVKTKTKITNLIFIRKDDLKIITQLLNNRKERS